MQNKTGIEPAALTLELLYAPTVLSFLDNLEQHRRNSVRSRNARLTAIRSFYRVVALREPGYLGIVTRVLAIPVKGCDKPLIGCVTRAEVDSILEGLNRETWRGRRDYALLLTVLTPVLGSRR
jgi:hypothetical protein